VPENLWTICGLKLTTFQVLILITALVHILITVHFFLRSVSGTKTLVEEPNLPAALFIVTASVTVMIFVIRSAAVKVAGKPVAVAPVAAQMPVKKNTAAPQRASAPSQKPQGGVQSSGQSDIAVAKALVMDAVSAVSPEKLRSFSEHNLNIKLPGDTLLALLVLKYFLCKY